MKSYTGKKIQDGLRINFCLKRNMSEEDKQFYKELEEQIYDIYNNAEIEKGAEEKSHSFRVKTGADLSQADFYQFLERKFKAGYKNRQFRKDKRVIVNKLFEVIEDELINRNGGVVLEGLGYMAVWVTPKKVRLKDFSTNKNNKFIHETDGYFYNVSLFTEMFRSGLNVNWWTMDRAFFKRIKRAIFFNIAAGKKYKFYYKSVKAMYKKSYSYHLMESGF